jgi:hypothetical protein
MKTQEWCVKQLNGKVLRAEEKCAAADCSHFFPQMKPNG